MPIFQPIQDVVKDLCLREGDLQQLNKMLYLNCAKDVWMDLNLSCVKVPVRERFQINKKTNTINLPKSSIRLSGVDVEGADGVLYQPAAATTSPSVFFNRHTHTRRPAHRIRCNAYTTDER